MTTAFIRFLLLLSMLLPPTISFAGQQPMPSARAAAAQHSNCGNSRDQKKHKKDSEKQDKKKKKTADEREWERKLMGIYG